MNSHLQAALKKLEQSTEALLLTDHGDIAALCEALECRADAITEVALLIESCSGERNIAEERLSGALRRGEAAVLRALGSKHDATEEWMQLNRLVRVRESAGALTEAESDCPA